MTGQSHWFDYISAPIMEHKEAFLLGFYATSAKKGHAGGFWLLFNQTFCHRQHGFPFDYSICREVFLRAAHTQSFVWTPSDREGVDVGGLLCVQRSERRTRICLGRNDFNASPVDFLHLCSLAAPPEPHLRGSGSGRRRK